MLRLELIEGLRIIIVVLLSYLPTVAIAGWFEAWVAHKSGDDVPEQLGFLTFDPIVHFNVIGFAALIVGQLFGPYIPSFLRDLPGWGRFIPLVPSGINPIRTLFQCTARALAHLIMMLFSFFILVALIKTSLLNAQTNSAVIQSIASVLLFFQKQNYMLCIIYTIIGLFRTVLFNYFPEMHQFSSKHIVIAVFSFIMFIFVGSAIMEWILHQLMSTLAYVFLM
ncbi:hypothetical protein KAZ82_00245 [Candidatus Babeliales bacterium]|nr:hypothetical protein [Candidatus Babeliales bacterium]